MFRITLLLFSNHEMSLVKNTSITLIGSFLANVLAYVFNIYVARMTGPTSYGVLGTLLAILALAAWVYNSFFSALTKEAAILQASGQVGQLSHFYHAARKEVIYFLFTLMVLLGMGSGVLTRYFSLPSVHLIFLSALLIGLSGMMLFNQSMQRGLRQYLQISIGRILEALIRLLFVFIFLYMNLDLAGVLYAYGAAYLFIFIWTHFQLKNSIPSSDESRLPLNRANWYHTGFKLFLSGTIYQLAFFGSSLAVQYYFSSTTNGYWTAGINICRITLVFSDSVIQVLFPELSGERDPLKRRFIIRKAFLLMLLITGSAALICGLFPEWIIRIFYGKTFDGAIDFLPWQGLMVLLVSMTQLMFTILLSKQREKNLSE
ncbi:MAG: oligosaccharide flippase family protein [Chitinophagaceae bacterium]|nr:oligosaccharide flippase family protein [Chitinophagaceae bacterium]